MMKKFLLSLCVAIFIIPLMATETETNESEQILLISVNKSKGGILSIFNLYGNVQYNLSGSVNAAGLYEATLDCTGAGFTACRVPRDAGSAVSGIPSSLMGVLVDNVNDMIESSERSYERGIRSGVLTKKIAQLPSDNNCRTAPTFYFIKATWDYSNPRSDKMTIVVSRNSISSF